MDTTILDHLGDSQFLLLKGSLPVKHIRDDEKSDEAITFLYTKRKLKVFKLFEHINITDKQKISFFDHFSINVTDLNGTDIRALHGNKFRCDDRKIIFSVLYSENSTSPYSYNIHKYLDFPEIWFNFGKNIINNLMVNLNKEITGLLIRDKRCELSLNYRFLHLATVSDGKTIFNLKISDASIDSVVEKFNSISEYRLNLELHSDSKIKRVGITLKGRKEGFSYESDVNGRIKLSTYRNDILHGYYFNDYTNEQGFYQDGVKVGFWEEKDQLVNYDKELIFFILPFFPF